MNLPAHSGDCCTAFLWAYNNKQHDHYPALKIQGSRREDLCSTPPAVGWGLASKVAPAGPPAMNPDAVHQEPRYEP